MVYILKQNSDGEKNMFQMYTFLRIEQSTPVFSNSCNGSLLVVTINVHLRTDLYIYDEFACVRSTKCNFTSERDIIMLITYLQIKIVRAWKVGCKKERKEAVLRRLGMRSITIIIITSYVILVVFKRSGARNKCLTCTS